MKKLLISFGVALSIIVFTLVGYHLFFVLYYPVKYEAEITAAAQKYVLPPSLVMAVIRVESSFHTCAVSPKDAIGLMQLLPETARGISAKIGYEEFYADMLFEPAINIEFGAFYLKYLINKFDNTETALAAYNAGEGNVSKWLSDNEYSQDGTTLIEIPYSETAAYVRKALKAECAYRKYHKIVFANTGQDVIIFEEFRSRISISNMLNYLDVYGVTLPARYGDKTACYTKVFIISNWKLEQQYKNIQTEYPETWKAFCAGFIMFGSTTNSSRRSRLKKAVSLL